MKFLNLLAVADAVVRPLGALPLKPPETPLIDWVVGDWTGSVLQLLAMRAKARGDLHEFNHIMTALSIGNSSHGEDGGYCGVPKDRLLTLDDPLVFTIDSVTGFRARAKHRASTEG